MTSTPLIEAKEELAKLYARKATAESLDSEKLAPFKSQYDAMCARIRLLEDVVAAEKDGPARQIMSLFHDVMAMGWHDNSLTLAEKYDENLAYKIKQCEFAVAAAYEKHDDEAAIVAIAKYSALIRHIRDLLAQYDSDPIQMGFEEVHMDVPFDK